MKGVITMAKFELSEIMKLLDAGYTKDEITAMENQTTEDPQSSEDPKPNETTNGEEQKTNEDPNIDISSAVNELKEVFEGFKKELTAMNIMNSRIEKPDLSGEDVIAKIINPFNREKEK